jgi:hypothetical protein
LSSCKILGRFEIREVRMVREYFNRQWMALKMMAIFF